MCPPHRSPANYYSPVMSQQLYYLLSPTDVTILLHTTDAIIYSHPTFLAKINQGAYILFDASALTDQSLLHLLLHWLLHSKLRL